MRTLLPIARAAAVVTLLVSGAASAASAEPHEFEGGGHGFGLGRPGTTSEGWIAGFYAWLKAEGFLRGPR